MCLWIYNFISDTYCNKVVHVLHTEMIYLGIPHSSTDHDNVKLYSLHLLDPPLDPGAALPPTLEPLHLVAIQ